MQIDLYLPCIAFQVSVRPGDSSRPTDLECAALHFIAGTEHERSDNARQLERFLGLGGAVFQDLLIRMVNRCWVILEGRDKGAVLRLSDDARAALRDDSFTGMGALEQGRSFTVCYDLLGGGLASIPARFRSKAMAEPVALQPVRGRKTEAEYQARPYRKPLNGFLPGNSGNAADPYSARLLQALQSDRGARGYLRDQGGVAPALHVAPPGKVLSWSDVEFYRCRFNVYVSGTETEAGLPIPVLECTEQRNATVRKLGQANAQAIVEDALAGTDTRLIGVLRKAMAQGSLFRRSHSNPIETMLDLVRQDASDFAELEESWDVARERVYGIAGSRLDRVAPVDLAGIRDSVTEMARRPGARLLIASPFIRSSSPELSADPRSLLSALTECEAVPLVHGAKGANARGGAISDQTAIARITTALPRAKLQIEDQSLDHVRTPFVADDGGGFLWLADSPFGDRGPGSGLRLDFAPGCGARGFAQLVHALPWPQQDWIEEIHAAQPASPAPAAPLPEWVAQRIGEVESAFEALGEDKWRDPDERPMVLKDLARQIEALDSWIRLESESAEFLAGAAIQARAAAMLGPRGDKQTLVLGLSGRTDLRFLGDITDQICARLSRQDIAGMGDAPLHIFLPDDPEAAPAVELFERRVGRSGTRHRIITQVLPHGQPRPASFVLAPATALLAHDGLVRFVPSIGRKVKGLQLAVQLQGRQVERDAAQFLAAQWPAAAEALTSIGSTEAVADPGLSSQRRRRMIEAANQQHWFDDGNVGATTIALAARDAGGPGAWDECFDLAVKLLVPGAGEHRDRASSERLGYAGLKAVAGATESAPRLAAEARARLAQRAAAAGDLLVSTILADHLPDGALLRDPQARKLAYALARQLPPHLTPDDWHAIAEPSPPLACLCCLLMLDGLGEELAETLRAAQPARLGPEAAAAQALARYLHEHEVESIEDLGLEPEDSSESIDETVKTIVNRIDVAAQKVTKGLRQQVYFLQELMFSAPGAFAFDLRTFLHKTWPDLPPSARGPALARVLAGAAGDLGLDVYAAVANNVEIRIAKVAQAYFDRKNEEMTRTTVGDLVDLTKAGKFMPAAIEAVLNDLVEKVIPALIKASDGTARDLSQAIRELEDARADDAAPQVRVLRDILLARFAGPDARSAYVSPAWRFPTLPASNRPDWPGLSRAMLAYEFTPEDDLAGIVDWFLRKDQSAGAASSTPPDDYLTRVIDVLEAAAGSIDAPEHERLTERLGRHLRELAGTMARHAAGAIAFEIASGSTADGLARAAGDLEQKRRAMDEALGRGELIDAILIAEDMRGHHDALLAAWSAASLGLLKELEVGLDVRSRAQLKLLLSERAEAGRLAEARVYLALRGALARKIVLDGDFQLEIGDGRVPGDTPPDTRPLMEILAKVRRGDAGALHDSGALSHAVTGFLSACAPAELLAQIRCSNDVWRIASAHRSFKALAQLRGNAELLVAMSRNAEIAIRARWQAAARSAQAAFGLRVAPRPSGVGGARDHPVLLSLFVSQPAPKAGVLQWRLLALLGRENARNRRIAVLGELSRQAFASAGDIQQWWRAMDRAARLGALAALLELPAEWSEEQSHLVALIELSGDACLALGLFLASDSDAIQLSEEGRRIIATSWNEHTDLANLGGVADPELLRKVMDTVIDTCGHQAIVAPTGGRAK